MQTTTSRPASGTQTIRLDEVRATDQIVTGRRHRARPVTGIEHHHDGRITVRYGTGSTIGMPDVLIDIRERETHPEAGNPYEQISAGTLRVGDVFASGIAVEKVEIDGLIVTVDLADGTAYRYGDNNPVLIKRRTSERVEARELRDDDVLVNPETGQNIPVRLVAPHNGLILVWTDAVNAFAISPSATIAIARRNVSASENREGFPHVTGGFCGEQNCSGGNPLNYDGHMVWTTAEAYARDHHPDGEECPNLLGCGQPDCHKAGA